MSHVSGLIASVLSAAVFLPFGSVAHADDVAAGGTSVNSTIPRCTKTLGDLSISEGVDQAWHAIFVRQTSLTSITPLLRNYVLQSNCFRVTIQGNASEKRITDTARQARGGEFRPSDQHGANQRVAANYYMEPVVDFTTASDTKTNLTGLFGQLGGLGGAVRKAAATVTLELSDVNAGVLVASAVGHGKSTAVALPFSSPDAPPDQKALAAALLDAFSSLVPG